MLRSFTVENFQSFLGPTSISLVLNGNAPQDERSFTSPKGTRLSKAVAIIGANASGKTSLVKALAFVDWFTKNSFHIKPDEPIPLLPHFLATDKPSTFEVVFEMEGREWRYRLVATPERVYHESLYSKQSSTFSYVFVRDWNAELKEYEIKQHQFGLLQKEAKKVRENASLISTAAQYDIELAVQLVSTNVWGNVDALGRKQMDQDRVFQASAFYAKNDEMRERMAALLSQWDFGLADVAVEKHTITRENGQTEEMYLPFGIHRTDSKEQRLTFWLESSGTQGAFVLLSLILPTLMSDDGGLVIIDELEADLHPHMLTPILDLFFSQKTNPHNAQIIFTCHSIEVLSLLHKAQVVLVEKNSNCQSEAWRLDSVKHVRADDNLYAKYMAGAYGATPHL